MDSDEMSDDCSTESTDEFMSDEKSTEYSSSERDFAPGINWNNMTSFEAYVTVLSNDLTSSEMAQIKEMWRNLTGHMELAANEDNQPCLEVKTTTHPRIWEIVMIPNCKSQQKIKNTSFRMKCDRQEKVIYVDDNPECQKLIFQYCRELFPMLTPKMAVHAKSYHKLVAMTRCEHLYVLPSPDKTPFSRFAFHELMLRLEPMRSVHFETYIEIFYFAPTEKLFTLDYLSFSQASWIGGDDFLDMKNRKLKITGHKLTDSEINRYIMNWKNGGHTDFEILCISYNREPTKHLWKKLEARPVKLASEKLKQIKGLTDRPIVYCRADMSTCMEIVPVYGPPATIFFDSPGDFRQMHIVSNKLLI